MMLIGSLKFDCLFYLAVTYKEIYKNVGWPFVYATRFDKANPFTPLLGFVYGIKIGA